ncbi:Peptidase, S41 family [uncultured Eubacteriales bacterium]|uniref:Peptidase, S41 family n=1 Tax=uncultured Eubacteriales bacterium TaxID=172733 RepID=A0A212J6U8_9FIRM|nr:Peptidase, S41 family [uncultured Eubacteriales bacterium]
MKMMRKLLALLLTLSLLAAPALALTTEQAAELLDTYYVDGVPDRVLEQTTVEGMLEALGDPYTEYFDAETYASFMDSMKDTVTYGIGVSMQEEEGGLRITEVLSGLGAEKAGILAGDLVTAVDGKTIVGVPLDTARGWISGEEGTQVLITVSRDGKSLTYTVTRAKIVIEATASTLVDGHIGYIICTTFGPETYGHFADGIEAYDDAADRWIVDLRSNGGGDVDASVQSAGTFVGSGDMAYLQDSDGRYGVYRSDEGSLSLDPVIVLTDGYTASASEMFSFIVRDRQAGLVIGERTYGKGVAQIMLDESVEPDYFEDGSALKVTAYRIFSPDGATDDRVGVIPHLLVDAGLADSVAYLLSASNPKGDTKGMLRIDMGWRWYVDLNVAASKEFLPVFTALLEAVPESTRLWLGTGGADGWQMTTADAVAERYGLTGYAARAFSDTENSPYAAAISSLATYEIISGPGDGAFLPDATLTRGQLCSLLAQALRYTSDHTGTFADVPADAYYAPAVEAMYAAGLVAGGGDGLFHPDEPVDHQQYITILARAAQRLSMKFAGIELESGSPELEQEALAPYAKWARESVWLLDGSQVNPLGMGVSLLWESLTDIAPTAPTTRAEAAAGLYSLLAYTGILPA